jgi:hypothetical protein
MVQSQVMELDDVMVMVVTKIKDQVLRLGKEEREK